MVTGPFQKFSEPIEGDDVTDVIVRCRHELTFSDQLPAFDPPNHTAHRHLLMRLITPKNLKQNEDFMWDYADVLIDRFVGDGTFEVVSQYAEPFTLTVVADLEGVPEADHELFRERLSTVHEHLEHKPLEFLYGKFSEYITDRRREPRNDILSGLANAKFPDGSTPEVSDAALLAANLFAGGQETTVRLLVVRPADARREPRPATGVARRPRPDPQLRRGDVAPGEPAADTVPHGTGGDRTRRRRDPRRRHLMLAPGMCNRDERVFPDPHTFDLGRVNARQHIAFGHGIHTCAGAPLARAEGRVTINRLLDRLGDIRISESVHGPAADRRYEYLPTFFLRGLQTLHVDFTALT